MKKLIVISMFVASTAQAQVMFMPNQGGGEIVLTDRPCVVQGKNYSALREAYAWTPTIKKLSGCWFLRDGNVSVIYENEGDERIYPIEAFRARK